MSEPAASYAELRARARDVLLPHGVNPKEVLIEGLTEEGYRLLPVFPTTMSTATPPPKSVPWPESMTPEERQQIVDVAEQMRRWQS